MPAAARIQIDRVLTGHTCSMITGIEGPGAPKVIVMGGILSCATDALKPHTIRAGRRCIPHAAIVKLGAPKVNAMGRPAARMFDPADRGMIITGAFKVFIGNF